MGVIIPVRSLHEQWLLRVTFTVADIRPGSRLSPLTLVGWLTLIKAAMFVVLPSAKLVALYSGVSAAHILISGSLTLLLGLYLTVSGFRAPLEKSKH